MFDAVPKETGRFRTDRTAIRWKNALPLVAGALERKGIVRRRKESQPTRLAIPCVKDRTQNDAFAERLLNVNVAVIALMIESP